MPPRPPEPTPARTGVAVVSAVAEPAAPPPATLASTKLPHPNEVLQRIEDTEAELKALRSLLKMCRAQHRADEARAARAPS